MEDFLSFNERIRKEAVKEFVKKLYNECKLKIEYDDSIWWSSVLSTANLTQEDLK